MKWIQKKYYIPDEEKEIIKINKNLKDKFRKQSKNLYQLNKKNEIFIIYIIAFIFFYSVILLSKIINSKHKKGKKALNKNIIVLNKIKNETKDNNESIDIITNSTIPDIINESTIISNTIANITMKKKRGNR